MDRQDDTRPAVKAAAQNELINRTAQCDWDQARAIAEMHIQEQQAAAEQQQAQAANNAAMLGAAAVMLQQSQPHYIQPTPTSTNCRWVGPNWVCNSY